VSGPICGVSAISFDFYNTLATHREGESRGQRVTRFLEAHGWQAEPWRHELLDDLFALHGSEYEPDASARQHQEFCERVAATLFSRMDIQAPRSALEAHALDLWSILGPDSLVLFPDVEPTLARLKSAGYRLVVTSNWHCGLGGFCRKLGVGDRFDHVLASAEVGVAKPDRRIFDEVSRRLGLSANQILHVGDNVTDDWNGARNAGFEAVLLQRDPPASDAPSDMIVDAIRDLRELPDLL